MKRFLVRIAIFFALLFVIDRVVGYTVSYMTKHSKGGYVGHHNYITDKTNEDILIFGSSRAIHHYNPQIITDSLGLSCYNCGQDGNGIVLFYGWWQLIKEHYKPKVIIYDVTTSFDLLKGEANNKYLGWLKESYERDNISDLFKEVDKTEQYKMLSQMYRYNSKFLQVTTDYIHPVFVVKNNGFLPMKGEIDTMRINKKKVKGLVRKPQFDEEKLELLNKFIDETDGVRLIFVASPMWYGIPSDQMAPIRELCQQRQIPFFDYSNSPKYVHVNEYFKDGQHLNAKGADEFSRDLVKDIHSHHVLNQQEGDVH